jgi:hypothetical protein
MGHADWFAIIHQEWLPPFDFHVYRWFNGLIQVYPSDLLERTLGRRLRPLPVGRPKKQKPKTRKSANKWLPHISPYFARGASPAEAPRAAS